LLPKGPSMGEAFCSLMINNAQTFPSPPEGVTTCMGSNVTTNCVAASG
jgi:hypothetical protein